MFSILEKPPIWQTCTLWRCEKHVRIIWKRLQLTSPKKWKILDRLIQHFCFKICFALIQFVFGFECFSILFCHFVLPFLSVSFLISGCLISTFSPINIFCSVSVDCCAVILMFICIYRVFHNCWNKAAASKTFIDDLVPFSLSRLS